MLWEKKKSPSANERLPADWLTKCKKVTLTKVDWFPTETDADSIIADSEDERCAISEKRKRIFSTCKEFGRTHLNWLTKHLENSVNFSRLPNPGMGRKNSKEREQDCAPSYRRAYILPMVLSLGVLLGSFCLEIQNKTEGASSYTYTLSFANFLHSLVWL